MPQGTKLGVILFTVMTKKFLFDQRLRIKYDDDNSALEIIPRNSSSLLNIVESDIHSFAMSHNIRLNPTKCNFLLNASCLINTIIIGGSVIECVNPCKISGLLWTKTLSGIAMSSTLLRKPVKVIIAKSTA